MLRTLQVSGGKAGITLHDARLGKAVLDMTPREQTAKEIDKLELDKQKCTVHLISADDTRSPFYLPLSALKWRTVVSKDKFIYIALATAFLPRESQMATIFL